MEDSRPDIHPGNEVGSATVDESSPVDGEEGSPQLNVRGWEPVARELEATSRKGIDRSVLGVDSPDSILVDDVDVPVIVGTYSRGTDQDGLGSFEAIARNTTVATGNPSSFTADGIDSESQVGLDFVEIEVAGGVDGDARRGANERLCAGDAIVERRGPSSDDAVGQSRRQIKTKEVDLRADEEASGTVQSHGAGSQQLPVGPRLAIFNCFASPQNPVDLTGLSVNTVNHICITVRNVDITFIIGDRLEDRHRSNGRDDSSGSVDPPDPTIGPIRNVNVAERIHVHAVGKNSSRKGRSAVAGNPSLIVSSYRSEPAGGRVDSA